MFKNNITFALQYYTKRYLKKHQPKLVVIVGSVGKTSTKVAIATVLSEKYRVRSHEGNHNSDISTPLAILGIEYPEDIRSVSQWFRVLQKARERIRQPKDVDVIVQELGTDNPGDIAKFTTYLKPDVAVITAVSPEHMEFFTTIEAVAKEELGIAAFSKLTVINRDDIDVKFADLLKTHNVTTYGLSAPAEYRIEWDGAESLEGKMGRFISPNWDAVSVNLQLIGNQSIKVAIAAGALGVLFGLTSAEVAVGLSKLKPVSGRMQLLRGLNDTKLLDDTYNSSPLATKAALDALYKVNAPQRIAILGSMNELGAYSAKAHTEIGEYCDPNKLAWVVTIGTEAQQYLAPAAQKKGNQVKSFDSPYEAGGFVHSVMTPGAIVLAKGSQNGVFAEEALKVLLHSTEDEEKLVRQTQYWLDKKKEQFAEFFDE